MPKEIFKHIAILTAHIAQKFIEQEHLDKFCISPCDLAVICHDKHYVHKDFLGKMLDHLANFDYMEKRGEVFVLSEPWRRILPGKIESEKQLKEIGIYSLISFQELLSKHIKEIMKNDSQKIKLSDLLYYLDSIDGSKGLQSLRGEILSLLNGQQDSSRIFDFNYGLGYSAIQLATIYESSEVYSMNLNNTLRDACDYTIKKYSNDNLVFTKNYPSEMFNKLIKEKVDSIFIFNPLGLDMTDFQKTLNLARQISREGTKLIIMSPFSDYPLNVLVSEWLGMCVENIGDYWNIDTFKVNIPLSKFEIQKISQELNLIIASYHEDL